MYLQLGEEAQACHVFEFEEKDYPVDLKKVKDRFRKISLKYHPDKNPTATHVIKSMDEITGAYNQLKEALEKKQLTNNPFQKLQNLKTEAQRKIEELKELEHSLEEEKMESLRLRDEIPGLRATLILLDDKIGKLTDPHEEKKHLLRELKLKIDTQKSQTFKSIYLTQCSWMWSLFHINFVEKNKQLLGPQLFENIEKSEDNVVKLAWQKTLEQLQMNCTFVKKQEAADALVIEVADLNDKIRSFIDEKRVILARVKEAEDRIAQILLNTPTIVDIIQNRSLNIKKITEEIQTIEAQLIEHAKVTMPNNENQENEHKENESKDMPVIEDVSGVALAFKKIFAVLKPGKTVKFRKNFLEENDSLPDDQLLHLARNYVVNKSEKNSRTACAYRLANIYYSDVSSCNYHLLTEIYKFNFGRELFKKCSLGNKTFFTNKALKKDIGFFTPADVDVLQKNDSRMESIIKGLSGYRS